MLPQLRSLPPSAAAKTAFLSFTIAADGGITVTDKATGKTYAELHHFYDVEDAGDEYTYCPCHRLANHHHRRKNRQPSPGQKMGLAASPSASSICSASRSN